MSAFVTLVHLTLHEAMRRRVLVATLIGAAAFLLVFGIGFHFVVRDAVQDTAMTAIRRRMVLNLFTLAGLYATHFLSVMTAVLLPVDTLSGEIGSGVLQTVASKPVRRRDIVLGKWAAYAIVAGGYTLLVSTGVLLVARLLGGFTPPGLTTGLPLMVFESVLLVTLSIFGGSRFSTVTNGILAFALYGLAFIGGWVDQIGTMVDNAAARNVGTVVSLIMPSEAMWQRAAYHMPPAIMRDLMMSPFSPASLPSVAMVVWAAGWALLLLVLAVRGLQRRAL
ncbi:MAG: ABC transporter permease subunit [bacterium]